MVKGICSLFLTVSSVQLFFGKKDPTELWPHACIYFHLIIKRQETELRHLDYKQIWIKCIQQTRKEKHAGGGWDMCILCQHIQKEMLIANFQFYPDKQINISVMKISTRELYMIHKECLLNEWKYGQCFIKVKKMTAQMQQQQNPGYGQAYCTQLR